MINPELAMWRTVLVVGLHEAAKGKDTGWLGSKDFHTVCDLAQVDAEGVLRAYAPGRFQRLQKAA